MSKINLRSFKPAIVVLMLGSLLACSRTDQGSQEGHQSNGQVGTQQAPKVSYYAAARFAEQTSFGVTPELITEIQSLGFEAWIDKQLAMPITSTTMPRELLSYSPAAGDAPLWLFRNDEFWDTALAAPDQLRQRVTWAVFQYIPVSAGQANGSLEYYNMLRRNVFGNYAKLLRDVTLNPHMGFYLNNELNRPTSPQCLGCTPNENYARELMQLFTVGVVQLNSDGSVIRDAQGKAKETYTQKDVEELARALTGWRAPSNNTGLPDYSWPHYGSPMVPESASFLHDSGAKTVMGTAIPAGLNASDELDAVVALLMKHQNVAPFVSLRLIQHLVGSNPSPQYLARVSAVFRNNGKGVTGDMAAVVKAVLLDPEARAGDVLGVNDKQMGYLREPVLWMSAVHRGLGCKHMTHGTWQGNQYVDQPANQNTISPPSIFSYYQATDRAPGSNLLAPEQKLLNTMEFTSRLGNLDWRFFNADNPARADNLTRTGCNWNELTTAFAKSPDEFLDLLSKRWFRGAMPATLRNNLLNLIKGERWQNPESGTVTTLQFALTSPSFGVIK
ncbi:DUF1800 family protein [Undibacterium cyanobacteriorum]|uniref:DUF1800 family protein n=1 Tax=Undibacterium cyanobacteriorum TaxID=3073561 RepID=A0ABY9RI16_9BURK|nr:DUF1800 family protein [Undibacterium sp. 20NA77.5]WMW79930.1 DUF1800 family protein [Undibacterium sp. 20NA77.5]